MNLSEKIIMLHKALQFADINHLFGSARALARCTPQAQGATDIDLNIFLNPEHIEEALHTLHQKCIGQKKIDRRQSSSDKSLSNEVQRRLIFFSRH